VESIVAIVEAATSVTPMVPRKPEDTVHRPDCAAYTGPDRAAYHRTDWPGRAATLSRALLRAADDALCVPKMGEGQQCESERRDCQMQF
jgi:hypothetical protein